MRDENVRLWRHQVLIDVDGDDLLIRLTAMEAWLGQWAIPYRAVTVPRDNGLIRACFADEKFARAFQTNFGGLRVPADQLATELAADPAINDIHEFVKRKAAN